MFLRDRDCFKELIRDDHAQNMAIVTIGLEVRGKQNSYRVGKGITKEVRSNNASEEC